MRAACFYFFLTLLLFARVLFASQDTVLSVVGGDLYGQDLPWRTFAFTQLRNGHLPLWNPHIFSGTPFVGGFQSGLFDPLNTIYLILPIGRAINLSFAIRTFIAGMAMFSWCTWRRLEFAACIFGGTLYMLCGANFPHIVAGHLTFYGAAVWCPLVFLAVEGAMLSGSSQFVLLGAAAVAMQILAGAPQYFYFTGLTAGIYALILLWKSGRPARGLLQIVMIYAGAAGLTAVELFTGMRAASEGVRSAGLPYHLASSFAFPPQNLLTLLAPKFWGDTLHTIYWGDNYFWEMCVFCGVTGVAMAGLACRRAAAPARRFELPMLVILLVLALGSYTPLHKALYYFLPGFNRFRGAAKFMCQWSAFFIMLAAIGYDSLLQTRRVPRYFWIGCAAIGAVSGVIAAWLYARTIADAVAMWGPHIGAAIDSGKSYLAADLLSDPEAPRVLRNVGVTAAKSLLICGASCALISVVLFQPRRGWWWRYSILMVGSAEMLLFSWGLLGTFSLQQARRPAFEQWLKEHPGDYRVLFSERPNFSMTAGWYDIWGYGPSVLRRYSELMTLTQGGEPQDATQYVEFEQIHPVLRMLRCRFALLSDQDEMHEIENPLPRALLISNFRVLRDPNEALRATADENFDAENIVLLESEPGIQAALGRDPAAAVTVHDVSTDELRIEATTSRASILLLTDCYSKDWHAEPLPDSVQTSYRVMPANYVCRGIPLQAGNHHIRLFYRPAAFVAGCWVSCFSLACFLGCLFYLAMGYKRKTGGLTSAPKLFRSDSEISHWS